MQIAFALDCHDREMIAHVAAPRDLRGVDIRHLMKGSVTARFGDGAHPDAPIKWPSDNGSMYTALDTICAAERLNLVPITTLAASPQSNAMAEAFVNTLRRDYIAGADLSSAEVVLEQVPGWIADYNGIAQHSASVCALLGGTAPRSCRYVDSLAQSAPRIGAHSTFESVCNTDLQTAPKKRRRVTHRHRATTANCIG